MYTILNRMIMRFVWLRFFAEVPVEVGDPADGFGGGVPLVIHWRAGELWPSF